MRGHPLLYQINTWVWLTDLSKHYGATITLENIPDEELERLESTHIDAVWLMGIWERSPHGRLVAQSLPNLLEEYRRALPTVTESEIIGSPYAVHRYEVDPRYGGRGALAAFRARLARRGIGLILDYVPNHAAVDNPSILSHPAAYVQATPQTLAAHPDHFFTPPIPGADEMKVAHGRDPYFPPWSDTAQVDAFAPEARHLAINTLLDIASQCDGVRCDMAMLLVNRVFAGTWGRAEQPSVEYWQEVIPSVRRNFPHFLFIAEVYWDMESDLIAQGFDYCYDKRLLDRLLHEPPQTVRDHLTAALDYQRHMVRFVENHDEARAVAAFGPARGRVAAALCLTLPGMGFIHEGQIEGRQVKVPVQLGERPAEAPDAESVAFYRRLLDILNDDLYHDGVWMMLAPLPFPNDGANYDTLIAYAWAYGGEWAVVIANISGAEARARIMLPNPEFAGPEAWRFEDVLNGQAPFALQSGALLASGLPALMPPNTLRIYRVSVA